MTTISITNIPAHIAKKLAGETKVHYDTFLSFIQDSDDKLTIHFNPPISADTLLEELQTYNG